MGEQHSDGGRTGRRRAHPGDPAPDAAFEALLTAALRAGHVVDDEAEQRAVHAFRAARDAGAHRARTRRRDDWRPRRRFAGRSLRTALSVLLAGCTLGGVAFAAIGGTDSSSRGADDVRRPPGSSAGAPGRQGAGSAAPTSPSASASHDHPETARDTEARCRAYEEVKERGKSLEATAWRRLVDVAGGEKKVDAFCARELAEAEDESGPGATPGGTPVGSAAATDPDVPAPATPDIPAAPTTNAPVNPTGPAPATPTAADRGGVTENAGEAGDSRPEPDKDAARND